MIDVSHIVTVYNKEKYLPDTVASLLHQEGALAREFLFVDDFSTDRSMQIIEELTRGRPNVTLVRNSENKGPSVRLNQGAKLAQGKYLHFLDSDDMLPANAVKVMHKAIRDSGADFLYGAWKWTHKPGAQLREERIPHEEQVRFSVSDDALGAILDGRNKRMCLLVKRALYEKAGGADPRIFIQDESLPLRLAVHAKRFTRLDAVVNLIPDLGVTLSANKSQLNHDRFFAYRNALLDNPNLPDDKRARLYGKCLSAYWKETRSRNGLLAHLKPALWRYVLQRYSRSKPDLDRLAQMSVYFLDLPNILRCA